MLRSEICPSELYSPNSQLTENAPLRYVTARSGDVGLRTIGTDHKERNDVKRV